MLGARSHKRSFGFTDAEVTMEEGGEEEKGGRRRGKGKGKEQHNCTLHLAC